MKISHIAKGISAAEELLTHPGDSLRLVYTRVEDRQTGVPIVKLADVCPFDTQICLGQFLSRKAGTMPYQQQLTMACLVAACKPKRILEIGTFQGITTYNMALNAPEDAHLWTLDMPYESDGTTALRHEAHDTRLIVDAEKRNRRFLNTPVEYKIKQLFGDSATFDFAPNAPFDFALIDGGHSYEYVRSDTERILPLLRKPATLVWDDYPTAPGVKRYIEEVGAKLGIVRIADTLIAFATIR